MSDLFEVVMEGPGKNALGTSLMESILARLDSAKDAPLLFVGAGDAFSAGLNLKEIATLDVAGMRRFVELVERLMARLFDWPAPTVACVNGHAIAGGCIIALCCDHRVATEDARTLIGLNEVALGLVFPPKIARIVHARVPPRSIHEVVLRGGLHAPASALRTGLVDELAGDPRGAARSRLEELAALPRHAFVSAKRFLREGVTAIDAHEYARALDVILPSWASDEVKQRALAHLQRR